jgi:hypothetical protein
MKRLFPVGTSLLVALAASCASAPPVNERAASSTAAIRAAEEVGAPKVPRAALHLQLAKEEAEHASGLIASGDKERAASLLLRAEADAELAVTLSREEAEKAQASEALDRVRQIQQSRL